MRIRSVQSTAVFLLSICFSFNLSAQSEWQWRNPLPQGDMLSDVATLDANTFVAVGPKGNILRTTDAGATWTQPRSNTIAYLHAVAFATLDVGYAVGDRILPDLPPGPPSYTDSRTLGKSRFVSGSTDTIPTMIRTTDGGATWTPVLPPTTESLRSIDFVTPDTGFAVGENGALLRTTNGGTTWQSMSSGTNEIPNCIEFITPNIGTIVTFDGSVLRTTDAGVTWNPQTSGTTQPLWDVSFKDTSVGVAVGWFATILNTTDGGATWTPRSGGNGSFLEGVTHVSSDVFVAVGDRGTLLRSTDNGVSWEADTVGFAENPRRVSFLPNGIGYVVGVAGRMYRSTDGGSNWQDLHRGTSESIYDLRFLGDSIAVAVCSRGSILRSTDGGITWNTVHSSPGTSYIDLDVLDSSKVIAVGSLGTITMSTNGGVSWSARANPSGAQLNRAHYLTKDNLVASGRSGTVVRSTNGGASWNLVTTGRSDELRTIFTDSLNGFSRLNEFQFLRTTNGGQTWSVTVSSFSGFPFFNDLLGFHFFNGTHGIATARGGIARTTDGGTNWTYQDIETSDGYFYAIRFRDSLHGVITSLDSCYITEDGGTSWRPIPLPPVSNFFAALDLTASGTVTIAGQYGAILQADVPRTTSVEIMQGPSDGIPIVSALLQNYPNPFNPTTAISYQLSVVSNVELRVFDLLGREVAVLVNKVLPAGRYVVTWNADGLASGVYLYRLQAGEHVETRKLVLLR